MQKGACGGRGTVDRAECRLPSHGWGHPGSGGTGCTHQPARPVLRAWSTARRGSGANQAFGSRGPGSWLLSPKLPVLVLCLHGDQHSWLSTDPSSPETLARVGPCVGAGVGLLPPELSRLKKQGVSAPSRGKPGPAHGDRPQGGIHRRAGRKGND